MSNDLTKIQSFGGVSSTVIDSTSEEISPLNETTPTDIPSKPIVTASMNISGILELFNRPTTVADTDVFTLKEVSDSSGMYFNKYKAAISTSGISIKSREELGFPCTVNSDKLERFSANGTEYYYHQADLNPIPTKAIEEKLSQGESYKLALYLQGNFRLTPEQSSYIMGRYKQFYPIVKEESGDIFLIVGEIS